MVLAGQIRGGVLTRMPNATRRIRSFATPPEGADLPYA
jgi:hypothetical protein